MNSLKQEITTLLADWCDGLLRYQINAPTEPDRHGGLMCPDCGFIHGRCADALYPFLRRAHETGDAQWVDAAVAVQKWSDNVSLPDGSFVNDAPGNSWDGITVFGTLALAQALFFHGGLLPDTARARWTNRLEQAAQWINGMDWSNKGTINYPISAAAALASAYRVLQNPGLLQTAKHWGNWSKDYFLPGGILFGEGQRVPTKRGVYAVDALYNLEESLPNFALYAEIAHDDEARALIVQSFGAHLDFLLPDGSIDAGWGSRSFKWTLWGSRTSDGLAGLLPLAHHDTRIAEAVRRNIGYLRSCTHDGLLYGGPHVRAQGRAACIHHTFAHAKALAEALNSGSFPAAATNAEPPVLLPCDTVRGIQKHDRLGTVFVSTEKFRASFTASDVFYGTRASHASGGAITMLWHKSTGPLCVSSMSRYDLIEGRNMAPVRSDNEIQILTPRLEKGDFSSALDFAATLETGENTVTAHGHLTNLDDETASAFHLETRFEENTVFFSVKAEAEGVVFVLPVVSQSDERVKWTENRVTIGKPRARVVCQSSSVISGDAVRIFHFVPGVQAVHLQIAVPQKGVAVRLQVEEL